MLRKIEILIQNAVQYYRVNSLHRFLIQVLAKLGFQYRNDSLVFLMLDLYNIPDEPEPSFSFHILSLDEITKEDNYDDGWFTKTKALHRIEKGHHLFVYKEKQRAVFFLWVEQKNACIDWFRMPINIPSDMAYISGEYTDPEFRNKGIATNTKKIILKYLKNNGINRIILVVHPNNAIALRLNKNLGFKEYQTINYRRYWHIRYYNIVKADLSISKRFFTLFKSPKDIWKFFA